MDAPMWFPNRGSNGPAAAPSAAALALQGPASQFAFPNRGSNGPAAVPSAAAPALQGPASQREVPSGALAYRPGFRRRRAVLWQLAELGMGSGGRRASQSDAAPGWFYGTDAPEELSFGTPGGPGGQRRYTGRLRIVPMTSEAIFRRLPMEGSLGEALRKEGGPLEGSSGQRPGMTASSTPASRDGPMLPAFGKG